MRRPHLTKRGWVVVAIVGLLVIGVAAWLLVDAMDEPEVAAPTSEPEPEQPEVEGTGGFVEEPEEYPWGEVHFTFEIEGDEGNHLNVYFVNDASEGEILTAATDCVDEFLGDYLGTSCYGFDTEEALEFAEPNPENGGMTNRCWRAFFSDSEEAAEGTGAKAGGQYEELGCP